MIEKEFIEFKEVDIDIILNKDNKGIATALIQIMEYLRIILLYNKILLKFK